MRNFLFLTTFLTIFRYSLENDMNICAFNSTSNQLPSTWSFSTLDKVKNCFENISLSNSIINETMKQLFNSLDFYSFLTLSRDNSSPYHINVDLKQELLNIMNNSNMNIYKNDYDFHMSINYAFKKLKDYHTRYLAPYGYGHFYLLLPFLFEYVPATRQIKIKHTIRLYSLLVDTNRNENFTDKIISKIDDKDAFEYIKEFSEKDSIRSKDMNVRLNSVFREEFWLRNLAEYTIPKSNSIRFTFADNNQTTVSFPYAIIITKIFNNRTHFENDNKFSLSQTRQNRSILSYVINFENLNWYENKTKNNYEYIMGNYDTYYYAHKSTNISIVRFGSFDDRVADDVKKTIVNATGNILIIDLVGNQGGASCLSYGLLNYLVPEYYSLRLLYEPMDGRTTKQLIAFSQAFNLFPNSILDLRNFTSFTNTDWIQPYVNYTRGNSTDAYSIKWSINCDGDIFGSGKYWITTSNKRDYFQSIYVLTDGTCGSACSLFLSKLKYASNFKLIYGIGGDYFNNDNDLFESSSYAGGGAFYWNDIVKYYQDINNDNVTVNYLPTSAYLNLNVYELYIKKLNENYPREFLKQPIDKKLSIADYVNLEAVFDKIITDIQSGSQRLVFKHSFIVFIFYIFL